VKDYELEEGESRSTELPSGEQPGSHRHELSARSTPTNRAVRSAVIPALDDRGKHYSTPISETTR
jgi:hypothetical protein